MVVMMIMILTMNDEMIMMTLLGVISIQIISNFPQRVDPSQKSAEGLL